jgi:hypothetical protein
VKGFLQTAPIDQKLGFMQAIATLPEKQRDATWSRSRKIGTARRSRRPGGSRSKVIRPARVTCCSANRSLRRNRNLRRALRIAERHRIIARPLKDCSWIVAERSNRRGGQRVEVRFVLRNLGRGLVAEKYAPKDTDLDSNFNKSMSPMDFPNVQARSSIKDAAEAYYTAQAYKVGDTSQKFDPGRWQQALDVVTGGVVNFRGSNVAAPVYGGTEQNLRDAIMRVTDADLSGAITQGDGQPFAAAMLKPSPTNGFSNASWRLESLGGGSYKVFSGDNTNRVYLYSRQGSPFVLNLKQQAQDAQNEPYRPLQTAFPMPEVNPAGTIQGAAVPVLDALSAMPGKTSPSTFLKASP